MVNITLSIPKETRAKMTLHPEIKWSNAIRTIIEKKLGEFEEAENIAKKSHLSEKDFRRVAAKIDSAAGKHAKALLA